MRLVPAFVKHFHTNAPTYIVGVRVPDKRPDNIVQRHDNAIPTPRRALKSIREVMRRVLDMHVARQRHPTSNDNKQDDNQLDDTEQILQKKTPFHRQGVDEKGNGDTGQADATLVPSPNFDIGRVEDVFAKDDAVAGGLAQQDGVGGVHGGG